MEPFGSQYAGVDPSLKPPPRERRRTVRHRVHTPAYASLNSDASAPLDLCEVLDISEQGVSIQTSFSGNRNPVLNLSLDLSETQTYIRTTGHVVWADHTGRMGVHFLELREESRQKLREWLFLNAMVAAANYVARAETDPAALPEPRIHSRNTALRRSSTAESYAADYTTTLSALAAVQREVEARGEDLNAALQLIAERARAMTRATGAAIAFSDRGEMLCLASAGDAPPVGTKLESGTGFSGHCIRTGLLQRCDNAAADDRVDRESCRLLGIRSMLAVPVRLGTTVVGLLEVFSSQAKAFHDRDGTVLQRLVDTVLAAVNRAARFRASSPFPAPRDFGPALAVSGDYPFSSLQVSNDHDIVGVPRRHLVLLTTVAVMVFGVLVYLLIPWVEDAVAAFGRKGSSAKTSQPAAVIPQPKKTPAGPSTLVEVRARAEGGDPYEQFALGTRYATGEDVPQDYPAAAHWFLLAAERGHVLAQDTLGAYYWAGRGVPKDVPKAYYWSVLARAGNSQASGIRVAFLTSHLTRGQVEAIQQQANAFLKQHPPISHSESPH